jgi:hypothetical protein
LSLFDFEHFVNVFFDETVEVLFVLISLLLVNPHGHVGVPTELIKVHEDHTCSRYCGRRGLSEVFNFKEKSHIGCKSNSVSVVEGEQLAVIKDGVHGLNPKGIYWAIQDHPLHVSLLTAHLLEHVGKDTVLPLRWVLVIIVTVKLINCN